MATKKGNGHDAATTAIVEVLERIEKQAEATNEHLGRLEVGLSEVRGELITFKKDVDRALTEIHDEIADTNESLESLRGEVRATNTRLDGLTGGVHALREDAREARELRERVTKTEAAIVELRAVVFKPTGT